MSPDPTHREVLFQLTDVARALRTYVDQCVRRHGMTRAQWGVLLRFDRHEGMTQVEMADALEIQPTSLVRLIDRLRSSGALAGQRSATTPVSRSAR
jgi:DNA-binding MarR family transcriptional regulator